MKTIRLVRRLLALAVTTVALAAATEPVPVAVFDFQAGEHSLEKKGGEIALLLNVRLSTAEGIFLVEREEVEKLLAEQEFGLTGLTSPESAAKVGMLVGAKVIVLGRVFESSGKVYLVAKIIGTETGRVFGETVTTPSLDDLEGPVGELAAKIAATVAKQADTFVAKTENESEAVRAERLKPLVQGRKLPAVLVTIPEQHLARPVIDPAAQTELMLLLRDVGFEVVDQAGAAGRSDVVKIAGEAFSEFGLRHGNFVSCRSRLEVTVKDPSGKLLLADRQMDVAVDIAEHSAGKMALERAALKLGERIVAKLAR